jgi:hypothetical protein
MLMLALGLSLLVVGAPSPVAAHHSASYSRMEHYALRLLNCLRTGGYVTATGRCKGYGSGGRRALRFSTGIANKVARPWARHMARRGALFHGNYDARFAAAGYHRYNGENIATGSWGSIRKNVISGIRIFQCEKGGAAGCGTGTTWHWRNLRNARFSQVGIGIAHRNGRTFVVYDFYD